MNQKTIAKGLEFAVELGIATAVTFVAQRCFGNELYVLAPSIGVGMALGEQAVSTIKHNANEKEFPKPKFLREMATTGIAYSLVGAGIYYLPRLFQ